MGRSLSKTHLYAFSLLELLVTMAIVVLLVGIVFAATPGVREKARQAVCISNLHQIGLAILIYREDIGGSAPTRAMTPEKIGLPPSQRAPIALDHYLRSREIWVCSDDAWPVSRRAPEYSSYTYYWPPLSLQPDYRNWMVQPVYYGMRLPVFYDRNHEVPMGVRYRLVLRLDGTVKREIVTFPPERFPFSRD
jgi:type II secretory pathway pseudopilin PulG